jgi:hypothetical protein
MIRLTGIDSLNSLSVGNGQFTFTVDATGLQTFPESYANGIPLGTMSDWGWYSGPDTSGYSLSDVIKSYDVNGRQVGYVHQYGVKEDPYKAAASEWLRSNPRRMHLGLIGLKLYHRDGSEVNPEDLTELSQQLDPWTGVIISSFMIGEDRVEVKTVCHPGQDMISTSIRSELLKTGMLKVKLEFPFTDPVSFKFGLAFDRDHKTMLKEDSNNLTVIERNLNRETYFVTVRRSKGTIKEDAEHKYIIEPDRSTDAFELSVLFSRNQDEMVLPSYTDTETASGKSLKDFWMSGGAVDFSDCLDKRAAELERRVILSQYLTRIQCTGENPPAETGLTFNSWYGKFHLEMHWWHAVHFALWNRDQVLRKQMAYYGKISDVARLTAEYQGYNGIRWPKMTDPSGRESPSTVGTYLIWQQPHPIFYSELLYINSENRQEVLDEYSPLVFSTADFMASYAYFDTVNKLYRLGPVLIPAQESLHRETTINPAFELVYWHWGLQKAVEWKKRLGEEPDTLWLHILNNYPGLPESNGLYICSEDTRDSYSNPRYLSDHPIVSGILGVLPETGLADKNILSNTLDTISVRWNWSSTWGWDFPMLAMSAAAVGRPEQAVSFLLMDAPKNRYLPSGHNYQDARLPVYLPGNGGLLTAVAKMCVEGSFPDDGNWKVKWEKLNKYPR